MTVKVATSANNFSNISLQRVYVDGVWKRATMYVRAEGTWKQVSLPTQPSGVTKQWEFKLCSNYLVHMVGGLNGCYVLATNNTLYYVNSSGSVVWARDVGTSFLASDRLTIYTGSNGVERVCMPRREDKRVVIIDSSGNISTPMTWTDVTDPYVCMGRDCIYASRNRSDKVIGKYNLSGATVWEYLLTSWIGNVSVSGDRIYTFEGQMLFYINDTGSVYGSATNTGERVGTVVGTGELGTGPGVCLITDGTTGRNYYGTKIWTNTSSLINVALNLNKAYGINMLCWCNVNTQTGGELYKVIYDASTVAVPLKADSNEVYVAGRDGVLAKFTCA